MRNPYRNGSNFVRKVCFVVTATVASLLIGVVSYNAGIQSVIEGHSESESVSSPPLPPPPPPLSQDLDQATKPPLPARDLEQTANNDKQAPDKLEIVVNTKQTQQHFKWRKITYKNNADFKGLQRLFKIVLDAGLDDPKSVVLVGGTNDGQGALNILEKCPSLTLHGFEIQKQHYATAADAFKQFPYVQMHNEGWDETATQNLRIGGEGEGAGLYDPQGQRGMQLQEGVTVSTVALAEWTQQNSIQEVLYVLIDTEGHEAKVIRGMHLEKEENRKKFSMFQYELGGTWAEYDSRRGGETWTQTDAAKFLEDQGYTLFIIGETEWLMVDANFFDITQGTNAAISDEGFGRFIQGNVLAVNFGFVPNEVANAILEQSLVIGKVKLFR